MKKRTISRLLAAALCITLAGCGVKDGTPAPGPAAPVQDAVPPDPAPDPAPAPDAAVTQPAEPAPPEPAETESGIADSFVGTWRDDARGTSGGRCFLEIACEDGENYQIDIWWGNSAAETTHWQYTGTYDEVWEGIDYIGTRYTETTQADGTVEQIAVLEEATGLLYLEDGVLLWEDTFEHTGEGMKFQREE